MLGDGLPHPAHEAVDVVVTEYGVAKLRARTVKQRVENLIAVAHPDFRAELRREANKYMYY